MATAIWNSSLRKGRTIKTEVQGSKFQKYSMKIVLYILNRPQDSMCFKAYPRYRAIAYKLGFLWICNYTFPRIATKVISFWPLTKSKQVSIGDGIRLWKSSLELREMRQNFEVVTSMQNYFEVCVLPHSTHSFWTKKGGLAYTQYSTVFVLHIFRMQTIKHFWNGSYKDAVCSASAKFIAPLPLTTNMMNHDTQIIDHIPNFSA